jgi:hypothetical protein
LGLAVIHARRPRSGRCADSASSTFSCFRGHRAGIGGIGLDGTGASSTRCLRGALGTRDRIWAALCYVVPVVSAVYVFAVDPPRGFVRVHAISRACSSLCFWAVAKAAEVLQPLTPVPHSRTGRDLPAARAGAARHSSPTAAATSGCRSSAR